MVTIINKNADFRLNFNHYVPPVDGALLSAFVGNSDPDLAIRNFGTSGDLAVQGNMPATSGGECFRAFTQANYMLSGAVRPDDNCTLIAVVSHPPASTLWCMPLSCERNFPSGGRRGLTLAQNTAGTGRVQMQVNGTSDTSQNFVLSSGIDVSATAKIVTGSYTLVGASSRVQLFDETTPAASVLASNSNATLQASSDDPDFPFRVGANYLGTVTSGLIGFVGLWPFELTAGQRAAQVASLRRYFAAYGVTV